MADEGYRRAFDRKPRFVPLLGRARDGSRGRRRDRGRRDRRARRWRCCSGAPACASSSTKRGVSRARSPAAKGSCRRASPCSSGSGCATPSAGGRSRPCATTASASTAEAPFPPAPAGAGASRSAQRRLRLDDALLGGGARDAAACASSRTPPVEGAGDRGRARRRPARRRRAPARRAWSSAPTASTRRCGARWGSTRRARADRRVGVRMHFRLARRTHEPSDAWRSSSAAATSSTRRRCPTASCWWPALGDRARLRPAARARALERWIAEQPFLRELARRRRRR